MFMHATCMNFEKDREDLPDHFKLNRQKPGQGEVGEGHLSLPNLLPHPQFSKDVLVNIYSAYIDNFLNAKDAVRVAKEARPAFLKFLEVCGLG